MRSRSIAPRIPNLYNTIHISALVQSLGYPADKKMFAQISTDALQFHNVTEIETDPPAANSQSFYALSYPDF